MKKLYSLRFFVVSSFLTIFSLDLSAQNAPAKQWDKTFGGSSSENLISMQQTSDGGYILGGSSDSGISGDKTQASNGNYDYWLVKLNASGNKVWDKAFGGSNDDGFRVVQQTADGGYILGGSSASGISGDKSHVSRGGWDYWVIKLDANGTKQWDKTFGSSTDDDLSSLKQTADGGYILGGTSWSPASGDKSQTTKGEEDYWIVKLDASGNKQWDKTIGGNHADNLSAMQQTADGGYILGGASNSDISGDKSQGSHGPASSALDYWVIKLDPAGNKVWDKTFGGNDYDYLFSLQQTSDGGYIFGGYSFSGIGGDKSQVSRGNRDYWVVKTDASGNKLWDTTLGGPDHDYLNCLRQVSGDGYLIGGYSFSGIGGDRSEPNKGTFITTTPDYWIIRLNVAGNKVWDKTLGGNFGDYMTCLQQTSDNGYLVGGYSESGISGDKSQASQGQTDFWILKLGPDVLATDEEISAQTPALFQNQPNPFSENTSIGFNLTKAEEIELQICNNLGQTVGKLRKKYEAGKHQLSLDEILPDNHLKAGVYFCRFSAGNFQDTKRMVKL